MDLKELEWKKEEVSQELPCLSFKNNSTFCPEHNAVKLLYEDLVLLGRLWESVKISHLKLDDLERLKMVQA